MRDELQTVLDAVQVEITRSYTDALTDGDKNGRLRDYIEKCVLDHDSRPVSSSTASTMKWRGTRY